MITAQWFRLPLAFIGRFTLLLGLVAIGIGIGYGFSFARANHTGDGAVHVCVNNSTGAMREVSNPNRCRSFEHAVNLDAAGAAGPVSGWERSEVVRKVQPGKIMTGIAYCSEGKKVLGGGVTLLPPPESTVSILESGPNSEAGWLGSIFNGSNTKYDMNIFAICAYTDAP